MITTDRYCLRLLDAVVDAGEDPRLAYVLRTRLRRALVAIERGRHDDAKNSRPLEEAPDHVHELVDDLRLRVYDLCQPSEALSLRWEHGWREVRAKVGVLQDWFRQRTIT